MSHTDTISRVWPVHLLKAASYTISIVSSISCPLAIMVDTIAIRSVVVRKALVDKRAGSAIISRLSRSLAIISTIAITSIMSMKTLRASVSVAYSMTISISRLSRSLAIISTIPITTIVSMKTLGASVSVAHGMTITISGLGVSVSRPLAISMSNVISISVMGRVVSISMVSLGDMDRSSSISMTISIPGLSLS